jgi:hypothetical protein
MVRTIVTPDNTHLELDIPVEYVGKRLEVTYLALDEIENPRGKKTMADFWGILSDETSADLMELVKSSRN